MYARRAFAQQTSIDNSVHSMRWPMNNAIFLVRNDKAQKLTTFLARCSCDNS